MDTLESTGFTPEQVIVDVITTYLPRHSRPEEHRYTFAYTITISNEGPVPVQLLSRHWLITDGDGKVQEVRGEGVVGEQPVIEPGGSFRYTSAASIPTPVGFMQGSYDMILSEDGEAGTTNSPGFKVPIPAFSLHLPRAVH